MYKRQILFFVGFSEGDKLFYKLYAFFFFVRRGLKHKQFYSFVRTRGKLEKLFGHIVFATERNNENSTRIGMSDKMCIRDRFSFYKFF